MFERIKEQTGDLLTEEDFKKMVDAAMQKAFFDSIITRIYRRSYLLQEDYLGN